MVDHFTRRNEFIAGVKDTLPLIAGAIPFGILFGAVAINFGLSPAATLGMSLFVFAGSAQFIAAGLIGGGTGLALIILTTFVVNLRHALYSASLAPFMRHLPQRWLLPLGFWLTDETYAVTIRRYHRADESAHKHWFMLGSALAMYLNWQLCTVIGIALGQQVGNAAGLGLDFAMVVTFIGIVIPLVISWPMLVCAVVAGISAVIGNGLPHNMGLMVAAIAGIAAGLLAEAYQRQSASPQRTQDG